MENGAHLRLIGIDTPEIRKKTTKGFVYAPQPFSLKAKKQVQHLVLGNNVRIEFGNERKDIYGRLLGYCFIESVDKDMFLNKEIVRRGLGVVSVRPPNLNFLSELKQAQKQARSKNRGLWGGLDVVTASEVDEFIGQIRTVQGRVKDSYKSNKVIFLNFGRSYKEDFTVAVFKDCWELFYNKGIEPEDYYKNKFIEVSGRIREHNGPEIIVCDPGALKVIK